MWVDISGSNLTSQQVCGRLANAAGVTITPIELEGQYRVGAIYRNGSLWFQRIS